LHRLAVTHRVQLLSSRDSGGWYPSQLAVPIFAAPSSVWSLVPFQTLTLTIICGYHAFCRQDFRVSVHLTKGAESDVFAFSPHFAYCISGPIASGRYEQRVLLGCTSATSLFMRPSMASTHAQCRSRHVQPWENALQQLCPIASRFFYSATARSTVARANRSGCTF
jgi:hypothetical protein